MRTLMTLGIAQEVAGPGQIEQGMSLQLRVGQILRHTADVLWCTMRGHELYVTRERRRIFQRCLICGHETAGWRIERPSEAGCARGQHTTH